MKQVFTINGESLAGVESTNLFFCVGETYLGFAVSGFPDNELYNLEYNTGEAVDGNFLSDFFKNHNIFHKSFNRVFVCFDYIQNLLVPHQFQQQSELLLKANHGIISDKKIISDSLGELNLYNVYAVPKDVIEEIQQKFPDFMGCHFFTNSIEHYINSIYSVTKNEPEASLLIDFRSSGYSVTLMQRKSVLLAQFYFYSSPRDVTFRLLKLVNNFSLSRDNINVKVSGFIEVDSALFLDLLQYFRHVTFREAIDWQDTISQNSNFHSHYFTILNDLVKCASLRENMVAEK